jgi:hypothetical protein
MADWQNTVNLLPEWRMVRDGELAIQQLAKVAAARLAKVSVPEFLVDERDDLIDEFKSIAEDESADTSDFDDVMDRLYDFGDTRLGDKWPGQKVAWIKTF